MSLADRSVSYGIFTVADLRRQILERGTEPPRAWRKAQLVQWLEQDDRTRSQQDKENPTMSAELERTTAAVGVPDHVGALVTPAASLEQIAHAFDLYQALQKRILDDSDFQTIQTSKGPRRFPKKSAWRKLAVAFGVSFELRERVYDRDDNGNLRRAEFVVRAIAPNGRFADGRGAADIHERDFTHLENDLGGTAETRAKNRAASDLFGMGEVSAEEMTAAANRPKPLEGFTDFGEQDALNREVRDTIVAIRDEKPDLVATIGQYVKDNGFTFKTPWPRALCEIVRDMTAGPAEEVADGELVPADAPTEAVPDVAWATSRHGRDAWAEAGVLDVERALALEAEGRTPDEMADVF